MPSRSKAEYYVVAVKRDYEDLWRFVGRYETREEAQAALDQKRSYVGAFNYDNAQLRVISRSEAKQEFGADWEYHPIGEKPPERPTRTSKRTPKQA